MYKIYNISSNEVDEKKLMKSVRSMNWRNDIPGGWLKYSPPRYVCGYGDGSLINKNNKLYRKNWKYTAWSGSVPHSGTTIINKTNPIPEDFLESGIFQYARKVLKKNISEKIKDFMCTGIWCNYYTDRDHMISAHTDDEDYYYRFSSDNEYFDEEALFVSLTLYEDQLVSEDNLARFQIYDEGWEDVLLPHMSLLIMSGSVKHRVLKNKKNTPFRRRYNITFRTPAPRSDDIIKNFRFFSNFGRYYTIPIKLYVPENYNETAEEVIKVNKKANPYLQIEYITSEINRNHILELINADRPPNTTTNIALQILYEQI